MVMPVAEPVAHMKSGATPTRISSVLWWTAIIFYFLPMMDFTVSKILE
jgi:hypothetical protein